MSHTVTLGSSKKRHRTWSLVHAGAVLKMSWADGERLLGVSTRVRSGALEPQPFVFCPVGQPSSDVVSLNVTADDPLDLIVTYDEDPPLQSHWFG